MKPPPSAPIAISSAAQDVVAHRLTKTQFVKRLQEREVIEELQRLRLWRSANDDEEHGFSVDDLWLFYCALGGLSRSSARAKALRGRGPDFLADGAEHIRDAVRFLQQVERVMPALKPWMHFETLEDLVFMYQPFEWESEKPEAEQEQVLIVGDLEGALMKYADWLQMQRPTRRGYYEHWFRYAWEKRARERTRGKKCLDDIGARLFEIFFDRQMTVYTYRRARKRDRRRPDRSSARPGRKGTNQAEKVR
jgi:hypothetical protein